MNTSSDRSESQRAAHAFHEAARLNRNDPLRRDGLLLFPNYGQLVMTGDLHGHRANFAKLRRYAMLDRTPARHVVLHELIHEDVHDRTDRSHQLLLEAALYKIAFPDQVHFLQSNHELSQLTNHAILKNGRPVLEDFVRGVGEAFGPEHADRVYEGILDFIDSLPLAGRTANRIWISHSLPAVGALRTFDPGVFSRSQAPADREPGGSVYELVWGRRFTAEHLDELATLFEADFFIAGHIPQETGYEVRFNRLIILSSDHSHGSFLSVDLGKPCTLDDLVRRIHKFAAVE